MNTIQSSNAETAIGETAQVKYHESHKAPPVLLPGRVTPALLLHWEEFASAYFDRAKTASADKVSSILTCFKDPEIDNWLKMNRDHLCEPTFSFTMFMSELRKRFLEVQWENHIMRTVVNSKMDRSESFSSFANCVIAGNNLLEGTPVHLSVIELCKTLSANMSEFLASKLDRQKATERKQLANIDSFEDWMQEIVSFDRETTADLKRLAEIMEENNSKRLRLNDLSGNFINAPVAPPSSFYYPSFPNSSLQPQPRFVLTGANAIQPGPFRHNENAPPRSVNGNSGTRTFCPALTEDKKYLLNKHHGCRKCRRFYVAHRVKDCPNDFPNGATYKTLTEEMALKCMRRSAVASTYGVSDYHNLHGNNGPSERDPSIRVPSSSSFSSSYTNYYPPAAIEYSVTPVPSASITTVTDDNVATASSTSTAVAAVLPLSTPASFVLVDSDGDSSKSGTEVSSFPCHISCGELPFGALRTYKSLLKPYLIMVLILCLLGLILFMI